jgi:hypothetical protein
MTGSITNPVVTAVDQMSFASDPSSITSPAAEGGVTTTDAALIARAVQQHPKAKPR